MSKKEKKYYWLRLQKDFFKRHDIRIVESMPNGKDYILFYLKVLCESANHGGNLRFSETIPYNEDMLATITNTNVDVVRNAIRVFSELHMIDVLDDGTYFMHEVEKMVGYETEWARKKRIYRKKQALIEGQSGDNVLEIETNEGQCPKKRDNVRQEKEIEKEIEKKIDIDEEYINIYAHSSPSLFESFESEFARPLSPIEVQLISDWEKEYEKDIIILALSESVKNNARNFRYIEVVLNSWKGAGVRTVDEAKHQIENRKLKVSNYHSQSNNKKLPDWFNNTDTVKVDTSDFDESELLKDLEDLRSSESVG